MIAYSDDVSRTIIKKYTAAFEIREFPSYEYCSICFLSLKSNKFMKAIIITQAGKPDVLQMAERPKPLPSSTEVLIKVEARCEQARCGSASKFLN